MRAPRISATHGQAVVAGGAGNILQGYDSGEIIGYEIDGEDGTLFAAEESKLSLAAQRGSIGRARRLSRR
jgi:hypothetical protein